MKLNSRRRNARSAANILDAGREDTAPELSLVNLVDLMLVFAVGLMLTLSTNAQKNDVTAAQSPATAPPGPERLATPQKMKPTDQSQSGTGSRIGIAYRLANGDIVYVPENSAAGDQGAQR